MQIEISPEAIPVLYDAIMAWQLQLSDHDTQERRDAHEALSPIRDELEDRLNADCGASRCALRLPGH